MCDDENPKRLRLANSVFDATEIVNRNPLPCWDFLEKNLLGTALGFLTMADRIGKVKLVSKAWRDCKSLCTSLEMPYNSNDSQLEVALRSCVSNRLTLLNCNLTLISASGIQSLRSLKRLQVLGLKCCLVTEDLLLSLAELMSLQKLDISSTTITSSGLRHLSALPLKELNLSLTLISNSGLDHLLAIKSLEKLDLSSCKGITYSKIGLQKVESLTCLVEVNLEGTPLQSYFNNKLLNDVSDGNVENVRSYLNKAWVDVNAIDFFGESALHIAADKGHGNIATILVREMRLEVNTTDIVGRTPVTYAALRGDETMLRVLVDELGADVNIPDYHGLTPMSYVALDGMETMVRFLVDEMDADVNLSDKNGLTPVSHVALQGNDTMVRTLFELGADLNIADKWGQSPLFRVNQKQNKAMSQLLVELGADVNAADNYGRTST